MIYSADAVLYRRRRHSACGQRPCTPGPPTGDERGGGSVCPWAWGVKVYVPPAIWPTTAICQGWRILELGLGWKCAPILPARSE